MKTDAQLIADVTEELRWEPMVTSTHIEVIANGGIVTLSGTVPHYAERGAAERAAQRVEGVRAIVEAMEVSLAGIHSRTDVEIAAAVVAALAWHVWVPPEVKATVENGWVTLAGSVRWGYERNSAENAVVHLTGVKGVTNNVNLRPSVQATEVKGAIEKALKRNAEVNADHIRVSAVGSKVTLAGTVTSWDERQEAGSAAWNAPGVTCVANELAVAV